MNTLTRNPLCWPNNVPRTAPHHRGWPHFNNRTLSAAASFVLAEINRLNDRHWNFSDENVIISSNLKLKIDGLPMSDQKEPADTGIAVYFRLRVHRGGKWHELPIVLACDKWVKSSDNLYAIGKDIEAQRARQRWGCTRYEQSFRGYLALSWGHKPWWEVLGISSDASKDDARAAYRELTKTHHPDVGGNREKWDELTKALEQATL